MSSRALSRWHSAVRNPYLLVATCLALVGVVVVTMVATMPAGALDGPKVQATWRTPPHATCSAVQVPVKLAPIGLKLDKISGELCVPAGPRPSTVQVLVAGATYDRYYWNPPDQPQSYSYVWAATRAGYATLDIDPLGTGLSSHPLSALVTVPTSAYTVHQVIQAARNGSLGASFSRVILTAHSMGTALAWNEVANYQDVDGLIASDNVHIPSLVGAVNGAITLYPAMLDPKFAKAGLDPGYLTTRPGTRISAFYNSADADSSVVAADESLKQVVTATFMASYFAEDVDLDSSRIHVPVLVAAGQHDSIMCGLLGTNCSTSSTLLDAEAPFYGNPATCLQSYVLPRAGHDINLSVGAAGFFGVANRWANRWVGSTGAAPKHTCSGPAGPAS
ncbi:MAG TPA: alpha/beta hydrolase [Jatrophihabitantaceae bacterium]|jgi:pimeloyl-ACP methyl ester carboxylesterase